MAVRTVVVDDNLIVREGVLRLLEFEPEVEVVACCATAEEALAAVETLPDAVLTDIRMPPTHTDEGLALARRLRERHPHLGVVVLSQHVSPAYAIGLLEDGPAGRGYLLKDRLHDLEALGRRSGPSRRAAATSTRSSSRPSQARRGAHTRPSISSRRASARSSATSPRAPPTRRSLIAGS